jgi:Fic family protein
VPERLEELCDYVNDNWGRSSALHLAAYVLWRMNWIHPFVDGNGRTSRVVSYLVLCVRLGYVLPGTITIPEQISKNKDPYYQALEAADIANAAGKPDLTEMEKLLESLLASQLVSVIDAARSKG